NRPWSWLLAAWPLAVGAAAASTRAPANSRLAGMRASTFRSPLVRFIVLVRDSYMGNRKPRVAASSSSLTAPLDDIHRWCYVVSPTSPTELAHETTAPTTTPSSTRSTP